MIYIYNILTFLVLPLYIILLVFRILIGKENVKQIGERFGITCKKQKGNQTLIWIHAASIGEGRIALNLIEHINSKSNMSINFLITSTTRSSAEMLNIKMPENCIHQLIPIDNIIFIILFFIRWSPKLGIFIESELWPCLIKEASKKCKLLLINARISDRSFTKWKNFNFFFQKIVENFSEIIVQSDNDLKKYNTLGIRKNIQNLGNIKYSNKPLEYNHNKLLNLSEHFKDKKIILYASTHLEDEIKILNIIKRIKSLFKSAYFILIPRHPNRIECIIKLCKKLELKYSIKTEENLPCLKNELYIVNTFGELGLFFKISYISFIGGSFKHGGHNILEPGHFCNCIIFGPDISNFKNIANDMINNKAAIQIHNDQEMLEKLKYLLSKQGEREIRIYKKNAYKFVQIHYNIINKYLHLIEKYIKI